MLLYLGHVIEYDARVVISK